MCPGLVSVVIPCYNDEPEHLRESVASALAQTYPDVEIIVVDDGSTRPETVAALDALEGVRLVRQENRGVAAARNAGVAASGGELVQLLDADDRLDEQVVAEGAAVLREYPGAVAAQPNIVMFGEMDHVIEAWPVVRLADILGRNRVAGTSMVRRSRWDAVGGQWEPLRDGFEDWEFWIRVLRDGGEVRALPSGRLHYRVRGGSRFRSAAAEAGALTRAAIADANSGHHEVLLRAALERVVELEDQVRRDAIPARRYRRLVAPVRRLRGLVGR